MWKHGGVKLQVIQRIRHQKFDLYPFTRQPYIFMNYTQIQNAAHDCATEDEFLQLFGKPIDASSTVLGTCTFTGRDLLRHCCRRNWLDGARLILKIYEAIHPIEIDRLVREGSQGTRSPEMVDLLFALVDNTSQGWMAVDICRDPYPDALTQALTYLKPPGVFGHMLREAAKYGCMENIELLMQRHSFDPAFVAENMEIARETAAKNQQAALSQEVGEAVQQTRESAKRKM